MHSSVKATFGFSLRRWLPAAFAAVLLCAAGGVFAAPADEMRDLLVQGKSADAYAVGKRHPEALGDPTFDFYFGVAATDSGHASEGVLALERYALTYPDNADARLELARAYFILGEDLRAREEFDEALRLNPPELARAAIGRYLDAIQLREARYLGNRGAWIELGLGYDTNANGGTGSLTVAAPGASALAGVPISYAVTAASQQTRTAFTTVSFGGYASTPLSPGWALFVNGQADGKQHLKSEAQIFDISNYAAAAGVALTVEEDVVRLYGQYSSTYMPRSDGRIEDPAQPLPAHRLRTSAGGTLEWTRQLGALQAISASGQYASVAYAGGNAETFGNTINSNDLFALSALYRRAFIHAMQPVLSLSVNTGKETATSRGTGSGAIFSDPANDRFDFISRQLNGFRLGITLTPAANWIVNAGVAQQVAKYLAPNPISALYPPGVARHDRYDSIDASATYLYSRNLSFRGELSIIKQSSNVELFNYNRSIVAVKARYEFK